MLECKEDCPICGGRGWYRKTDDVLSSDYQKKFRCPNSIGFYTEIGLDEGDAGIDFDSLKENGPVKRLKASLIELTDAGHGLLYLWGPFGIGKTHCIKAATVLVAKNELDARYFRQNVLADELRSTYDLERGQQAYRERMNYYKNLRWLAIDEYGRERATDFSRNLFEELIDSRYEKAIHGNAMTVIVSNTAPEDSMNDYLVDRIRDRRCKVIELSGTSWRNKAEGEN